MINRVRELANWLRTAARAAWRLTAFAAIMCISLPVRAQVDLQTTTHKTERVEEGPGAEPTAPPFSVAYYRWQARGALDTLRYSTVEDAHVAAAHLLSTLPETRRSLIWEAVPPEPDRGAIVIKLVALLHNTNADVVKVGAGALGLLGEQAIAAAPALEALMTEGSGEVQLAAAQALCGMGEHARAVPALIDLLMPPETEEAARILGTLGTHAKSAIPALVQVVDGSLILPDEQVAARRNAASALDRIGESDLVTRLLLNLLESVDGDVLEWAAESVGKRGAHAAIPNLSTLLSNPDTAVQFIAAEALSRLGEEDLAAAKLIELLDIDDPVLPQQAATTLGRLEGAHADGAVQGLIQRLGEPKKLRQRQAIRLLSAFGARASAAVPWLIALLNDRVLGRDAALALGNMGERATTAIPKLIERLDQAWIGREAARALGEFGKHATQALPKLRSLSQMSGQRRHAALVARRRISADDVTVPELVRLLADPEDRQAATALLGEYAGQATPAVPLLIQLLDAHDGDVNDPAAAADTMRALAEHAGPHTGLLAEALYRLSDSTPYIHLLEHVGPCPAGQPWRVSAWALSIALHQASVRGRALNAAYLHGSGEPRLALGIRWLESNADLPVLSSAEGLSEVLDALQKLGSAIEERTLLDRVENRVENGVRQGNKRGWIDASMLGQLRSINEVLQRTGVRSELLDQTIARVGQSDTRWKYVRRFGISVIGHAAFWLLLWFVYPRSPLVQALFFWNKWIRRFLGLGYVGFLLTWVPALRRRLLAPFADGLLAEAKLDLLNPSQYFAESRVRAVRLGKEGAVNRLIPRLGGKILLVGESGLGKTQFARHLLLEGRRSGRAAIFLPARLCSGGVLDAIQSQLLGYAQDKSFLRSILYAGGLDVYVDGLNEVGVETRQRITEFAAAPGVRHLLLVTQPMDWRPPAVLQEYRLLPLTREQLVAFAKSRWPRLSADARIEKAAFEQRCQDLLLPTSREQPRASEQSAAADDLDASTLRILSNPMDLTTATELLARGVEPNVHALYAQQAALMAAEFKDNNSVDFPMTALAKQAFEMRLKDATCLHPDKLSAAALNCLESHHLALRRFESPNREGRPVSNETCWVFRHDKVADFFISRAFRDSEELQLAHKADPRFRGVYLMLALAESLEFARRLERILIDHAAKTKDHSLSDDLINIVNGRRDHEQARLETASIGTAAAAASSRN